MSCGAAATAFVVVLASSLVPYKILIHEDEYEDEYEDEHEKNQSRADLCGCQKPVTGCQSSGIN